jgi:hypothetical protein
VKELDILDALGDMSGKIDVYARIDELKSYFEATKALHTARWMHRGDVFVEPPLGRIKTKVGYLIHFIGVKKWGDTQAD